MMTADFLHVNVHLIAPSGVHVCCLSPCRRACSASADSAHRALHLAPPSNVQTVCTKRAQPAAIAAFADVLAARAATPLHRRSREPKRPAKT